MMLKVIAIKPFLFLWLGQVFSQLAINMLNFILLIRIAQLTRSNTATAIFILSIGVPALLFGSLAGVYVDRWSKKWVLIICNFLRAILILTFLLFPQSLLLVYILSFLTSSITPFFVPAEAPTIPVLVPENLLLSANSLFTLTIYITVIVGYVLAGPMLVLFGGNKVFLLVSLLFVIAGTLVGMLPKESAKKSYLDLNLTYHKRKFLAVVHDFKEGYLYLIRDKVILSAFLLLTSSQVLISAIASLAPGFAREVMGLDVSSISLVVVGPAAVGMIAGSLLAGSLDSRFHKEKLTNLGISGAGILLVFLSLISRFLFLSLLLLFFLGVANALVTVSANTVLQKRAEEHIRGRLYGFLTAVGGSASVVPVLLTGVLSDYLGVVKVIFGLGAVIILFNVWRQIKRI